jgi:2-methylcitrate dehydratase PrpD
MVTRRLAQHIASAMTRPLPPEVSEKAALHVLDTIAAMVSGTLLAAGRQVIPFVDAMRAGNEASLVGSALRTNAMFAALGNGMLAHADETDDSHAPSLTHPGCAVVPAALAMAERHERSGADLVRAVAAGYDVGPRIAMALGGERFFDQHHSSHSFGGLFGATAAAGALAGLDEQKSVYALAYAAQLASGNTFWRRDADHVEKAFDFGGMPAHGGVLAASMAAAGFTASGSPLEGKPGLFAAFPQHAQPELATEALGERYEVLRTAIKKWSVGSPIQAALDSLEELLAQHRFAADDVASIDVALPKQSAPVVDNRDMPNVSIQHQLALMIVDGTVTFSSSHDMSRMSDPALVALRARIRVDPRAEAEFVRNPRQAIVRVQLSDGRRLEKQTLHVHGTPGNPMSAERVREKARDLMHPVLGEATTREVIERLSGWTELARVSELMALLRPAN